jgi:hypothetical protein
MQSNDLVSWNFPQNMRRPNGRSAASDFGGAMALAARLQQCSLWARQRVSPPPFNQDLIWSSPSLKNCANIEPNGGSSSKCNLLVSLHRGGAVGAFCFRYWCRANSSRLDHLHSHRNCRCVRYLDRRPRRPLCSGRSVATQSLLDLPCGGAFELGNGPQTMRTPSDAPPGVPELIAHLAD